MRERMSPKTVYPKKKIVKSAHEYVVYFQLRTVAFSHEDGVCSCECA